MIYNEPVVGVESAQGCFTHYIIKATGNSFKDSSVQTSSYFASTCTLQTAYSGPGTGLTFLTGNYNDPSNQRFDYLNIQVFVAE